MGGGQSYGGSLIPESNLRPSDNIGSTILLWSQISTSSWTKVEVNANNIHLISSFPVDIYINNDRIQEIRNVKQLFINQWQDNIWIRRNAGVSVNAPSGDPIEGYIWIQYVAGSISYSEFYSPFEYLPTYGHRATFTWLAAQTSCEVGLNVSGISPRFVILTSLEGFCTANLIGTIEIQPTPTAGIARSWNEIIHPYGFGNDFKIKLNGGLLVPSNFALSFLNDNGASPSINQTIQATINMKLL